MNESAKEAPRVEPIRTIVEKNLSLSGNCAQAAYRCLEQRWNLEPSLVPTALSFYPCGTLFLGGTCGAALGCMMAMGLAMGADGPYPFSDTGETARLVENFCRRLIKQRGGITCRDILKFDPNLDPSMADRGVSGKKRSLPQIQRCVPTIVESVRITLDLMTEHLADPPAVGRIPTDSC